MIRLHSQFVFCKYINKCVTLRIIAATVNMSKLYKLVLRHLISTDCERLLKSLKFHPKTKL